MPSLRQNTKPTNSGRKSWMSEKSKVILIRNAHVHAPFLLDEVGWVLVENGRIILMGRGLPPVLTFGFIVLNLDAREFILLLTMIGGRVVCPKICCNSGF